MDELKQYVKNLWKLDTKLATLLSFVENSILADEAVPSVWWDEWEHEEKAWQRIWYDKIVQPNQFFLLLSFKYIIYKTWQIHVRYSLTTWKEIILHPTGV